MKQRTLITLILFLAALTVSAQNYSPCYKEKYAQGVALYNKGDYNGAKSEFVAAKECLMPNTKEADAMIRKCNDKLNPQPKPINPQPKPDPTTIVTEEYVVNGVAFKMVKVQGGTFKMGATSEQEKYANDDEKPAHDVTLSDFFIGETEVTQALWKAVMESEPTYDGGWTDEYGRGATYPAYRVSWDECVQFCNELNSKLSGKLPPGYKFALPTEAQWEFAARGGNRKNVEYEYAGGSFIDDVAWYYGNSGGKTHPVKGRRANALNLYDMSGNIWEWCADWYSSDYYGVSPSTNPQGPSSGPHRVLRGGSWSNIARICRVSCRINKTPDYRYEFFGFRLALVHQ